MRTDALAGDVGIGSTITVGYVGVYYLFVVISPVGRGGSDRGLGDHAGVVAVDSSRSLKKTSSLFVWS